MALLERILSGVGYNRAMKPRKPLSAREKKRRQTQAVRRVIRKGAKPLPKPSPLEEPKPKGTFVLPKNFWLPTRGHQQQRR